METRQRNRCNNNNNNNSSNAVNIRCMFSRVCVCALHSSVFMWCRSLFDGGSEQQFYLLLCSSFLAFVLWEKRIAIEMHLLLLPLLLDIFFLILISSFLVWEHLYSKILKWIEKPFESCTCTVHTNHHFCLFSIPQFLLWFTINYFVNASVRQNGGSSALRQCGEMKSKCELKLESANLFFSSFWLHQAVWTSDYRYD